MNQSERKINNGLVFFRKDTDEKIKKRSIFWFFYFLVCTLATVWPIYPIANRVYPLVLGMPLSMFWIVLWICITFIGAFAKFKQEYGG